MEPSTALITNVEEKGRPGEDKADQPRICEGCGREMILHPFGSSPSWGVEYVGLGPLLLCNNYQCRQAREKTMDEARARRDQENPQAVLRVTGVPKHFLDCSFETFQGGDKADKAVEILKNHDIRRQGLILMGTYGAGKTHLAVAMLRELVRKGYYNFRFVSLAQLISTLARIAFEDRGEDKSETESEILARYIDTGVLVLDDIGQHGCSKWVMTKLYLLIDTRYAEQRPTIITTNFTLDQIEASLGGPIASRLAESTIMRLTMPDYRKRGANSK